ncbi:DegT/DnrJ/EryC1/StrS family aminotransferase [Leucobacter weissii]|uniref:DegT/DnrJ/EryC1/StrS family aminotransferase n=1 Tax=Leucobacter weissii TaxID=1983706 RepID=A0A939S4T0_9MICO|nr:DegT/DnrJ/EryC1/StrS family aminotransferase [Leucobacter weissii]MBO1900594.1 DegT/DnrJ/EryC1/StrS family aminotransferase [Leucobacter weissii]
MTHPASPAEPSFIPLAVPNIGLAEIAATQAAVASGFVSSVGPEVEAFEQRFAQTVGATHAVACASGTAALHVALRLVGVGAGDEVLCSDFTFIGSANPIAYLGAVPVFVDSEAASWNLDPELVVRELDRRAAAGERQPAAIEAVHILGQPARLDALLDAAERHGVPVVEDAAESLGAGWSSGALAGRATGTAGRIGCFSFNGNKIATTGGGGMIVTDDAALAERARHLTTQAKAPGVGYLHDEVGYNYRLTNVAAALGNAQLGRLPEFIAAKLAIARRYEAAFGELPVGLPPRLPGAESSYWLYSILARDAAERDLLLDHLQQRRIGARALWRPLSAQPPFAGARRLVRGGSGGSADEAAAGDSVAASLFERGVSLPSSTELSEADQARVIDAVLGFYARG